MTVLLGKSLRIWPGRIGADVEILGLLAKVEVADAASDEIAGKTGCVEFFQDMEGIAVDHLERDRMLPPPLKYAGRDSRACWSAGSDCQ